VEDIGQYALPGPEDNAASLRWRGEPVNGLPAGAHDPLGRITGDLGQGASSRPREVTASPQ